MLYNIFVAALLIVATTVIHAGFMVTAIKLLLPYDRRNWDTSWLQRVLAVSSMILLMFLASIVEASLWAGTYLALGAISAVEEALYFSIVTYTTLGFGDVVLDQNWRLLSSLEAANGIIMFGWTTAIAVAVMRRIYMARWEGHHSQDQ